LLETGVKGALIGAGVGAAGGVAYSLVAPSWKRARTQRDGDSSLPDHRPPRNDMEEFFPHLAAHAELAEAFRALEPLAPAFPEAFSSAAWAANKILSTVQSSYANDSNDRLRSTLAIRISRYRSDLLRDISLLLTYAAKREHNIAPQHLRLGLQVRSAVERITNDILHNTLLIT